jgi:hypothetical protein
MALFCRFRATRPVNLALFRCFSAVHSVLTAILAGLASFARFPPRFQEGSTTILAWLGSFRTFVYRPADPAGRSARDRH